MTRTAVRTKPALPAAPPGGERTDPRALMAARLPAMVQPFLTWLTARPAPGEPDRAVIAYLQSLGVHVK